MQAPAYFQRSVNEVLSGLTFAFGYLDNILVFSLDMETHLEHLRSLFIKLREAGNSISLQQNQFLIGTQAFASPPDMASSGVWENIILTKTPTFEGLCRMLYFIILNFCQKILLGFFVDIW